MSEPAVETETTNPKIAALLMEYEKLKDEQISRIGFRDNMIYVILTVVGAIGAFAVSDATRLPALLIIPWACLILGWTYLVNDEKISAIGRYIRLTLDAAFLQTLNLPEERLFGWEVAHRSDIRRKSRKVFQLLVDEITFCVSGLLAVVWFWLVQKQPPLVWQVVGLAEVALLLILGYVMMRYADLGTGK